MSRPPPMIELRGVNHYVCILPNMEHQVYIIQQGIINHVLLDRSKTKLFGVIYNQKLCPFVIANPEGEDKWIGVEVELNISNNIAENTIPGTTLENILQQLAGLTLLTPYVREAIIV